eukprot:5206211-Amphidinium_carterae.1
MAQSCCTVDDKVYVESKAKRLQESQPLLKVYAPHTESDHAVVHCRGRGGTGAPRQYKVGANQFAALAARPQQAALVSAIEENLAPPIILVCAG